MLPPEPGQFVAAAKIVLPLRRHEMIRSDVAVNRKPLVQEREAAWVAIRLRPFLIAYPAENGGNLARRSSNAFRSVLSIGVSTGFSIGGTNATADGVTQLMQRLTGDIPKLVEGCLPKHCVTKLHSWQSDRKN
jgi:hypothetical protein